eukprot:scaffold624935_cov36-Prasinocladus_malaysianus.AAC.1
MDCPDQKLNTAAILYTRHIPIGVVNAIQFKTHQRVLQRTVTLLVARTHACLGVSDALSSKDIGYNVSSAPSSDVAPPCRMFYVILSLSGPALPKRNSSATAGQARLYASLPAYCGVKMDPDSKIVVRQFVHSIISSGDICSSSWIYIMTVQVTRIEKKAAYDAALYLYYRAYL